MPSHSPGSPLFFASYIMTSLSFLGFWQILEFDYHFKVVSHILNMIDSKSWPLDGVPRCEAIKALSELEPRTVMTQCFDYYLKCSDKDTDDGECRCQCFCLGCIIKNAYY